VGVATAPRRAARRVGTRGWGLASAAIAVLVAGPLLLLPLSFLERSSTWSIVREVLPTAVWRSLLLGIGVAAGTLVLGTALAVLLSFYDFPGRRILEWAVVLPLGVPAYILTFVLLGQYEPDSVVQRSADQVLGRTIWLPELRTATGAIVVLSLVLYPYVYLLARTAFVTQPPGVIEAARTLGYSHFAAIRHLAVPLARPSLAAGTSLAVMEALADFGTVNLLGYRALPDAIYRLWFGAFDRQAALQLGAVLLGLVALLVGIERLSRRRSVTQATDRPGGQLRRRLHGWRALLAVVTPTVLLLVVIVAPVAQLVIWALDSIRDGTYDSNLGEYARNSVLLAALTAALTALVAVVLVFAVRLAPTLLRRSALRVSTLGYAVPGSVAAAAVFLVLDAADDSMDVVLTGSLVALVAAYCLRFTTLALQSAEARMATLPHSLDEAARSLGARPSRLLGELHVPLLLPAIATGSLLVFVEVLKELPATALLRPFGLDTLAIGVWEATKESLYEAAALPALVLLATSIIPVALLVRATRSTRS
jgi:iron(III) transport system permease protein